jgi:hypothetical protein
MWQKSLGRRRVALVEDRFGSAPGSAQLSQTDELARVKARIKALSEKTVSNGCTEAEAMSAAEMVGRLLERYALSMEEIELREARCVQVEVPLGSRKRRPIDGCVPAIARFCDCKVWLKRDPDGLGYVFFGFETDTGLARYLFAVIDDAIQTELAAFRRRAGRGLAGTELRRAGESFQHGMAARIAERLGSMHSDRETSVGAQRATGTALIIAKHRIVDEALAETEIRLVSGRPLVARLNEAFRDGQKAGDRVNLDRPGAGGQGGDRRRLA